MSTMNRKQRRRLASPPPKSTKLERANEAVTFISGVIAATEVAAKGERAAAILAIESAMNAVVAHGLGNPAARDSFCRLIGAQSVALARARRRTENDLPALFVALDAARSLVTKLKGASADDEIAP